MKERKRKAMLVMPVIVAPFVVFIFWVLGLVGPAEAKASGAAGGLNLNLPLAMPSADSSWDKLRFYQQADKDSAKLRQLRRQDPNLDEGKFEHDPLAKYSAKAKYQPYPDAALNEADEQEKKVYEKISEIHRQLDRKPVKKKMERTERTVHINQHNEVDRLERMMAAMHNRDEEDPEMTQIRQLVESIKDIQHPERVSDATQKETVKSKLYEVRSTPARDVETVTSVQGNRFYSMDNNGQETVAQNIAAVVHDQQTVATGDLVKMRLQQPVFIDDTELPENSFVYGEIKTSANRIFVHIPVVQAGNKHFPVSLDVIGYDGMPGIPVRASRIAMAAAQTVDRSTQGLSILGVDHSFGAQVAGAAIQTGKQLLKKQVKVVRYTIPAGYAVQLTSSSIQ